VFLFDGLEGDLFILRHVIILVCIVCSTFLKLDLLVLVLLVSVRYGSPEHRGLVRMMRCDCHMALLVAPRHGIVLLFLLLNAVQPLTNCVVHVGYML